MSHGIFGNRFYSGRDIAPWHSLGIWNNEKQTGKETLKKMGSFYFEKRPITFPLNGKYVEMGDYAIVRSPTIDDPTEVSFGFVRKDYSLIQPDELAGLYDDFCGEPVETLGVLHRGKKIFITWKLDDIEVLGSDKIENYGLITMGYDGKSASSLYLVTQRVVCANTLSIAISRAENENDQSKGNSKIYSSRHNSKTAKDDLGAWLEYVTINTQNKLSEVSEVFNKLAQVELSNKDDVYNLLFQIYPDKPDLPTFYPEKLRDRDSAKIIAENNEMRDNRDLVYQLFSGSGTGINDNSAYSLLNAVTEWESWGGVVKKPINTSIIVGNRQKTSDKAYNVLADWVYNK